MLLFSSINKSIVQTESSAWYFCHNDAIHWFKYITNVWVVNNCFRLWVLIKVAIFCFLFHFRLLFFFSILKPRLYPFKKILLYIFCVLLVSPDKGAVRFSPASDCQTFSFFKSLSILRKCFEFGTKSYKTRRNRIKYALFLRIL